MLLGRENETKEIEARLDAGVTGKGCLLHLTGEAGIGKSALASASAELAAARGYLTLTARGWDGGGAPAFWPFIQIVRALLHDRADEANAALGPTRRKKLAELVPELSGDGDEAPRSKPDDTARFALFDATAGLLRDVARAVPLFVVFDDLHASDPSSLSMLLFVARELRGSRVVLVACHREREARGPEIEVELAKLVREGTTLPLSRLDKPTVAKLVAAAKGEIAPVIADLIFRTSEGVPLFVEEVVRSLSTPGAAMLSGAPLPAGVRGVIQERLKQLDGPTRDLLVLASVVGKTFTVGLLAALSDTASDLHDLLERAVGSNVLERVAPGRYAFAHTMIREVLYRDIAGGPRAKMHAAIVEAFDAGKSEATPLEHAHHALRAAPVIGVKRAIASAHAAARSAMAVQAFEDAAEVLRRALAVLDLAPSDDALRAGVVEALAKARAGDGAAPASAPPAPPPAALAGKEDELSLALEGEIRVARLGHSIARVKDSRGMQMLARLVERPGEEIHALDLSSNAPADTAAIPAGDAGEVLDREAIAAYRGRLLEVEEDLREAEGWNDAARIERARSEAEFLRAELSRAVGLGGRSRRANADAERARVNCQRRISDAMRRIGEHDATIGRHLLGTVRTGTFCVYLPRPR